VLSSKEKNTKPSGRAIKHEFSLASVDLEAYKSYFFAMSPPRVGASRRTGRSMQSSTCVPQTRKNEMPIVVDVN
jgi:hypothetical protein